MSTRKRWWLAGAIAACIAVVYITTKEPSQQWVGAEQGTPVKFATTRLLTCALPKPGGLDILDFGFYEPRYFLLSDEGDVEGLEDELGDVLYHARRVGEMTGSQLNADGVIMAGVLYPRKPRRDSLIRPMVDRVSQSGKEVFIQLAVLPDSYLGGAPSGEGFDPPYTPCRYQLAEIKKSDLPPGEAVVHFIGEDGLVLHREKVVVE